ncbi:MAG: recombination mediator RecR [Candidatus Margulisbacteria bacterium]|nr:recombination mediator RecR [Candidatus Margulisiibacteriota bacterium]MBU1021392.1 recombination mediator RecR [Candidatus Margulisiibacteriota bacterium]MBU1729119.1 recombination mediator RecR [Candidatus Margulisiibacteriota bacterium]MBU1954792.1 recombination mediator RecR [Candidatus Margulisiibacteriota bacterium]
MSAEYAGPMGRLIAEFKKMPGIGPKSAQRLAFYILSVPKAEAGNLAQAILEAKEKIKNCSICFNLTDQDPCKICSDKNRDQSVICVVADPKDMIAIEKTKEYKGLYHILGGVISPLDGIGPENLRVKELLRRLGTGGVEELVLATNPTAEGEATVIYLTRLLKPLGVKITRIAYGLPVGADMDYADEATLTKAFEGRRVVS